MLCSADPTPRRRHPVTSSAAALHLPAYRSSRHSPPAPASPIALPLPYRIRFFSFRRHPHLGAASASAGTRFSASPSRLPFEPLLFPSRFTFDICSSSSCVSSSPHVPLSSNLSSLLPISRFLKQILVHIQRDQSPTPVRCLRSLIRLYIYKRTSTRILQCLLLFSLSVFLEFPKSSLLCGRARGLGGSLISGSIRIYCNLAPGILPTSCRLLLCPEHMRDNKVIVNLIMLIS